MAESGLLLFLGSFLSFLFFFGSVDFFLEFFQSIHGDSSSGGDTGGEFVGSSSEGNFAAFTFPNTT